MHRSENYTGQLRGCSGNEDGLDIQHGLNRVGEDDLLIRISLLFVVTIAGDKLHLVENGRL